MKTCNIETPSSLRVMTATELERAVISSIKRAITKQDILLFLENRFETRRAANAVANQISFSDLELLHSSLLGVKSNINFNEQFFIQIDIHRTFITLRQ